ncbi:uncharacterized protein LOC113872295 isoform X3 [Abrus precatorius]|uniref:Uncharacterized protein LOC113872295 isoform X3 n=1 Tax=Abrus precatorius TaxID=3816 RepID=A0A8B8MA26_ABRPR|nr:uncharacterized protein LOC113872295 isoform X3 [Abrus precatorius]
MSATATATVVGSISTTTKTRSRSRSRSRTAFAATNFPATPLSSNLLHLRFSHIHTSSSKRTSTFHGFKRFSPVMEWQDCTVKMEIDVPVSVAYTCYSDREAIPKWMPFISSVKILPEKPELSRWSLKYKAFGRDIEFSWLARNMQPIPNQKIHWRSMEGLPNSSSTLWRYLTCKTAEVQIHISLLTALYIIINYPSVIIV